MEYMRDISLHLSSRHVLELKKIVYVPSIKRNLILVITLDLVGYSCHFGNNKFDLLSNSQEVGFGTLSNGLYQISLDPDFANSIKIVIRKKRRKVDENF